jgi:hypothetical protein
MQATTEACVAVACQVFVANAAAYEALLRNNSSALGSQSPVMPRT